MDVPRAQSFNVAPTNELSPRTEVASECPRAAVYPRAQSFAGQLRPRPEALLAWQQAVREISHSDARAQQQVLPPSAEKQIGSTRVSPATNELADVRAQQQLLSPSAAKQIGSPRVSPATNELQTVHADVSAQLTSPSPASSEQIGTPQALQETNRAETSRADDAKPGHSAAGASLSAGPPPSLKPFGLREASMESLQFSPLSPKLIGSPQALQAANETETLREDGKPDQSPAVAKLFAGSPGARPGDLRESSIDFVQSPEQTSWPSSPAPWTHASESSSIARSPGLLRKHGQQDGRDLMQSENYGDVGVEEKAHGPLPGLIARATVVRCPSERQRCTPRNPFWSQRHATIPDAAPSACNMLSFTGAPLRCISDAVDAAAGAPLRCISDAVDAADRDQEIEILADDLTTVHISSLEQRLDWQGFLTSAAATSLARKAFKSFDVEAEPPAYARPPPSARAPHGEGATQLSQFMQDDEIYSFEI